MSLRENVGVPAGSTEIEVDGVSIAIAHAGRGPQVICLHAIGHGGGDFAQFSSMVEDRFEVVRIDWPGQGRSGSDSNPSSARRYAELLARVMDRISTEPPIIIGNSIGGAAAVIYANKHPVRALVLCDTGGLVEVNATVRAVCATFTRFFAAGQRGAWWFKPAFRAYYRFVVLPTAAAAPQREKIIQAGYETAPILREAWTSFSKPDADFRGIAQSLNVPVWFAWARRDEVIPLARCMPCIRQLKHATVTKFDAGHAAFLEQPEAFVREFLKFAETLESPTIPQVACRA
jgi:pimeloyl-ACP methyl ester carboxylesterase